MITYPGVLNAIDQAERIGDHAVANLLRREASVCKKTNGCVYTEGHLRRSNNFPCRVEVAT